MRHRPSLFWLAVLTPLVVWLGVYLPRIGHGFLLDDFRWILDSRIASVADVTRLLHADNGFYRPVVALTFGVNEWAAGTHPFGYAIVNLLLVLACAAGIVSLSRAFGLSTGASLFAGAIWLFNMHATREALMWISGRTSLAVTFAAIMAARAIVRWRPTAALLWLVVALFSKEDAPLVAAVLVVWLVILNADNQPRAFVRATGWAVSAAIAVGMYLAMRAATNAMTPATAPAYYRFDFASAHVLHNAVEYLDRGGRAAVLALLAAVVALGWSRPFGDPRTRQIVACGATWFAGTMALALLIPARSDLYAMLPAVGASLIVAAVADRLWQAAPERRHARALATAIILPVVLSPVYWARTSRMMTRAEFSAHALADFDRLTANLPDGARVSVLDDREAAGDPDGLTIDRIFGGLLDDAIQATTGRRLAMRIDDEVDGQAQLVLALRGGEIQVVASKATRIASATVSSSPGSTVRRSISTAPS